MVDSPNNWIPLDQAAELFGYSHPESLRRRLRVLRMRGMVVDLGRPPSEYKIGRSDSQDKIVLFWLNPRTALIRSDAPQKLLLPTRGKRARS